MNPEMPKLEPYFLYGTAWKEEQTTECVLRALSAGYRAIDTANQRKHYYEEGVGIALSQAYKTLGLSRGDLFLQTKFTFARGQDHRKPYDENATFQKQVTQSFESSLVHLKTDYLDSFVLHGPSTSVGLVEVDWEVWGAMEALKQEGRVKYLGVSNVNYHQLLELFDHSTVKPTFVQNRCFADTHWDKKIRELCIKSKIIYQGFSLLTANWKFLAGSFGHSEGRNVPQLNFSEQASENLHPDVARIIRETGKNISQLVFKFTQQMGMLPLTGSRSLDHLKSNLEIADFTLTQEQLQSLENIALLK